MKIAEKLIWRETDDGLVIVDPSMGKVRVLNGVGAEIWRMLEAGNSISDIESTLMADYGISAETASADVASFVSDLRSRKLVA